MDVSVYNISIKDLRNTYDYYSNYLKKYNKLKSLTELLGIELLPLAKEPVRKVGEEDKEVYSSFEFVELNSAIVVTAETLIKLAVAKIDFEVLNEVKLNINASETFQQVADYVPTQNVYNNKCDVHMPGNMLVSYNEVMLAEDSCTDVLQDALNNGWRIIAACPQPDSRRPDYILGRWNPEINTNGKGADRG